MQRSKHQKKLNLPPIEINIEALSHEGAGIGRLEDGKVVFVEDALPQETISCQLTENRKRFAKGRLLEVLEASPKRVQPKCDVYKQCGGCALQHLRPQAQRDYKQEQLLNSLQKFANAKVPNILPAMRAKDWSYRRRVRLSVDYHKKKNQVKLGFRARNSHQIQATLSCDLLENKIEQFLPDLQLVLNQLSAKQDVQAVECCLAENGLAILLWLKQDLPSNDEAILQAFAEQKTVSVWSKNIKPQSANIEKKLDSNSDTLYYALPDDIRIEFLPSDFVQVNTDINIQLVDKAIELLSLEKNDNVLDLFCGLGNFTLPIASRVQTVDGVEGDEGLVHRARNNSALNNITNATFYTANLFDEKQQGAWWRKQYSKIILDPPRAGAAEIVANIDQFQADKIVYISCDPATLARDAGILINQKGYKLTHAGIADMFPHTAHIESVAVFER